MHSLLSSIGFTTCNRVIRDMITWYLEWCLLTSIYYLQGQLWSGWLSVWSPPSLLCSWAPADRSSAPPAGSALVSAIRAARLKEEEARSVLSASWSRDCHPSHASSLQQWQFLPRAVTESSLQLPQHLESALWSGPPGPQPAAGFAESGSRSPGGSETPAPASSIHSSEVQVSVPWGLPSWLLSFNNVTSSFCFPSPGGGSFFLQWPLHGIWRLPFSSFTYLWTSSNEGFGFCLLIRC